MCNRWAARPPDGKQMDVPFYTMSYDHVLVPDDKEERAQDR